MIKANISSSRHQITHHELSVSKHQRSSNMGHKSGVLWFTGLSGAGKSTIANLVDVALTARGAHTILLDGDNLRHGLNNDLGFGLQDRNENVRRVGEVAKLMTEAGLIVICALISPYQSGRNAVRGLFEPGEFVEIFVNTPLDICIERDPKGLYRRAQAQEIANFTGIHQAYEPPENPELVLNAGEGHPEALANKVLALAQRFLGA
jgi:adenylyl-sulfate kinase